MFCIHKVLERAVGIDDIPEVDSEPVIMTEEVNKVEEESEERIHNKQESSIMTTNHTHK